ncbi:MAG: iron-sulfur cluster repair protein YtfE [Planctomycetota bacterium]|nr:iron-sulfur cluster repair protein YtfE [Planctomycetota bacterium]
MTTTTGTITPHTTLADLAATRAGASRVFYRHGLDFCCHGRVSLADACAKAQLSVDALVRELEAETSIQTDFRRWDEQPLADLIQHLLDQYHAAHRAELPRLLEMARKVEKVHADKSSCPRGLADHLDRVGEELEAHMQKEEQVLFPMLLAGRGRSASMPIQIMEEEHEDHGRNLARLRELTHDFTPPEEACGTWRALYLGLHELDELLMQHIHLENNVLFPRALRS